MNFHRTMIFGKRHFISSQRYSLPGQPLLYLGLSIVDVASELGCNPEAIEELSFSYYWLLDPARIRILDLRNEVTDLLWNNVRVLAEAGTKFSKAGPDQPTLKPDWPGYTESFLTFLTSALCSFRRRPAGANDAFAPEYVLPQLLAHWARENKFDGIAYSSTRVDTSLWKMNGYLNLGRYRENVALFTKFDSSSNAEHDEALLGRFEISQAVHVSEVPAISEDEIINLRQEVVKLGGGSIPDVARRAGIDMKTYFEDLVFEKDGKVTPYEQTACGRVQLYLQYLCMNSRWTKGPTK